MTQLEKVELALRRVLNHQRIQHYDIGAEELLMQFADELTVLSADEKMAVPSLKDEAAELKKSRTFLAEIEAIRSKNASRFKDVK